MFLSVGPSVEATDVDLDQSDKLLASAGAVVSWRREGGNTLALHSQARIISHKF